MSVLRALKVLIMASCLACFYIEHALSVVIYNVYCAFDTS